MSSIITSSLYYVQQSTVRSVTRSDWINVKPKSYYTLTTDINEAHVFTSETDIEQVLNMLNHPEIIANYGEFKKLNV